MKDGEADSRTILETELIFGVRRRERLAWGVAIGGVLVGLGGVALAGLTLPLKETQAFLAIVDKDTGLAERAVRIEAAGVEQGAAVEQSLLYNYVKNRETYDEADNEARILKVYRMSTTRVQAALKAQWDKANPNYPPLIYGASGKVVVDVLSITPVAENTAQVRFTKRLEKPGEPDRIGKFYATVRYVFEPTTASAVELVWENPFGFTVTDYRITAESLDAQDMEVRP
ncbi:type IV secretion system protein [Paracoccus sp. WLY502]|uniref:virB8 family protein n=1 Tax=Paracoccus yibinensis TaxID=3068891 RepID=UPI002796AFA5|nr:type IV secretion system protein [Paracoccus sp. WLY502]MDQ1902052.1 type IV secretion system protein [Paracoccus sp. WLY502]